MDETTTKPQGTLPDAMELSLAVANIAERSQRLISEFLSRQTEKNAATGQGDLMGIANAFFEMTSHLLSDPTPLIAAQADLWKSYLTLWQRTAERLLNGAESEPVIAAPKGDKRFRDKSWDDNAVFDFIKQSYLLSARYLQTTVRGVEGLDDKTARKVDFYTRQFVDALAPTNFVVTNPAVLRETIESRGENLFRGLNNLLDDLERGKGQLSIRMSDATPFKLGETIATTPGKVVFQNDLFQLLQYEPRTTKVHRRPLLIMPSWINKFYILDLTTDKSFVRWAVERGHTVFVMSWVNPDGRLADKSFEDYMEEGFIAAVDAVEKASGEREINTIGYCIGGTLLSASLAYLAAKGDTRIQSATYFTTLVDFTDVGELSLFVDEDQLQALETRIRDRGFLEGREMAGTFNMLRANELIWAFVVNNYLMGKEPFPFDMLHWNSDSTRMTRAGHLFYLRNMYQQNRLVQKGGIALRGEPIDLSAIEVPSFLLATKDDHIAPWRSAYIGTQLYKGPVTFCLAASGHIAGVINPPADQRYSYWSYDKTPANPDAWIEHAEPRPGSWWGYWDQWIGAYSGGKVAARIPGSGALPILEDAPGTYVRVREI